jgi:hypothetical protein
MKAVYYVKQYAIGSMRIQQIYILLTQFILYIYIYIYIYIYLFFVRTSEQAAVNTSSTV